MSGKARPIGPARSTTATGGNVDGFDTLPIGTLRQILEATRWAEDDFRRLGLLK